MAGPEPAKDNRQLLEGRGAMWTAVECNLTLDNVHGGKTGHCLPSPAKTQEMLQGYCGRLNNSSPRISIYDPGLPRSVRKVTKASNQLSPGAEDCPRQSGGLRNGRGWEGAEDKHLETRPGEESGNE